MASGLPPVMSALGLSVLTTFNLGVLEAATTSQRVASGHYDGLGMTGGGKGVEIS